MRGSMDGPGERGEQEHQGRAPDGPPPPGAGAPVVLVHGFGSSSAQTWARNGWLDILAELGRTPVALDLLGHGRSPRPHDPAAYDGAESFVRDALPADPALGGVGFSAGADTLLHIALADPGRFERLALLGLGDDVFAERDPEWLAAVFERERDDEAEVGGASVPQHGRRRRERSRGPGRLPAPAPPTGDRGRPGQPGLSRPGRTGLRGSRGLGRSAGRARCPGVTWSPCAGSTTSPRPRTSVPSMR